MRLVSCSRERLTSFFGELPAEGMPLQPIAVSFDVHHLAMVEQPVENG